MKQSSKINFYIFAMRNIHKSIAIAILIILLYNKGIVPNSYCSNTLSVFRNSRGLYPHFSNVNYFLMRNTENNLQQANKVSAAVTSVSRNETNPLLFLQQLYANGKAKLFTISATRNGCYVRFKELDNTFYFGKATSVIDACAMVITKLNHKLI